MLGNFLCPPSLSGRLSVSRAYISLERPQVKANLRVLCPFSGIRGRAVGRVYLYVVVFIRIHTIRCGILRGFRVTREPVTEVLETVRKYYVARSSRCFGWSYLLAQTDHRRLRKPPEPCKLWPQAGQLRS